MNEEHFLQCPVCSRPMRLLITGGTGVIFKGGGWTPKFERLTTPPYDPEKDMESIERQRKDAGLPEEKKPWRPKKAVHPIRTHGIDMKKGSTGG